jgi:hypothetical protein
VLSICVPLGILFRLYIRAVKWAAEHGVMEKSRVAETFIYPYP